MAPADAAFAGAIDSGQHIDPGRHGGLFAPAGPGGSGQGGFPELSGSGLEGFRISSVSNR